MAREVTLLLTLAALGGTSYWLARREPAAEVVTAPVPPSAPKTAPDGAAPSTAVVTRETKKPAKVDHSRDLELPDGTFVPALNNAVDAAPLGDYWGPQPWSPIVGVVHSSAGIDWYQHEDGSCSTTQMVWRSDKNCYMAMTRVGHPSSITAPVAPATGR